MRLLCLRAGGQSHLAKNVRIEIGKPFALKEKNISDARKPTLAASVAQVADKRQRRRSCSGDATLRCSATFS
jgi:hypothetical protein